MIVMLLVVVITILVFIFVIGRDETEPGTLSLSLSLSLFLGPPTRYSSSSCVSHLEQAASSSPKAFHPYMGGNHTCPELIVAQA
mmetsp:Transcript_25175/g.36840  ORF Transcript_25175/g.36840 Transcript_25175/m.36840 type:complete len:84 (-) Transcript_25175:671-922(-)